MAKKPSITTALGIVKDASGLTLPAFAKIAGMELRRVQSYILGVRELPPLSELSNLESYFGIDLESLKTKRPKMISGGGVTPELLEGWRKNGGISPEGAELACEQMLPTLSATVATLAHEDRRKALLLIRRIQSLVDSELRGTILREKVKNAVESKVLISSRERYESGCAFLGEAADLPVAHPRWSTFVKKLNRNIPVTVERFTRPVFGVPIDMVEVSQKSKKATGFRSAHIVRKELVITQGGKTHRFFAEVYKGEISTVAS